MSSHIDFYFDIISPYSYIAHKKIQKIKEHQKVIFNYKPILLGGLHNLAGINAPAFNKFKIKNMQSDCELVSKKNSINDCLFATGGKINQDHDLPNRKSGCAALDMAYVASGRYDGYFQKDLNLWDVSAGVLLIKEAGGRVTEPQGNNWTTKSRDILVSNTLIHEKLLENLTLL